LLLKSLFLVVKAASLTTKRLASTVVPATGTGLQPVVLLLKLCASHAKPWGDWDIP